MDDISEVFSGDSPIEVRSDGVYVNEGYCCRCLEPCDDLFHVAVIEGDSVIPIFGLCEKCMDEVGVFVYQKAEILANQGAEDAR